MYNCMRVRMDIKPGLRSESDIQASSIYVQLCVLSLTSCIRVRMNFAYRIAHGLLSPMYSEDA